MRLERQDTLLRLLPILEVTDVPIYDYHCEHCDAKYERHVALEQRDEQFCRDCGEQLVLKPSVPAWFPSGKYGKGNR
jgi:putative FmdB family regulatory protein